MDKDVSGFDVFISFESSDKDIASIFYQQLSEKGHKVFFFPETQISGENYEKRIYEALRKSKSILLICNANSKASSKVQDECKFFATNQGKNRVAFIFEAQGFKEEHLPDVKKWKKNHRVADINTQIEHIDIWKQRNNGTKTKRGLPKILIIILASLIIAGGIATLFYFDIFSIKNSQKNTISEGSKELTNDKYAQSVLVNGYEYIGELKNGKPHGEGKILYQKAEQIYTDEDEINMITVEAGDYIEGVWDNGALELGTLFDKNGKKKELIIIGR